MTIPAARQMTGTVQRAPRTRKIPALELDPPERHTGRVQQWWSAKRQIWLDALLVWAATRAILVGLTLLVPPALTSRTSTLTDPLAALRIWYTRDAAQLIAIAQHGYDQVGRTAYFPLLPLLEHLLAPVLGGDYGLAGLVVSNVAFFGALVVLRDLVERDFGADTAHRAILYVAIFPTAFSFFAPYGESLALLFSVGAFAALRRRQWWLAGVLGGIAALASVLALLLLIPFAVEFLIARRYRLIRWWESLAALLIPAGTGVYALYLQLRFHDPLVFWRAQFPLSRGLQWPGATLVTEIGALVAGNQHSIALSRLALELAAVAAVLVIGALALWRLPLIYGLYTLALLASSLLLPSAFALGALQSGGRFVAMLFPVFVLLAQWGVRDRMHEALLLAQVTLLTLLVIHFFAAGTGGAIPLGW